MPFGPEAKTMLQSLVDGQPLHLFVYDVDQYGRLVADVHCHRGFVQVGHLITIYACNFMTSFRFSVEESTSTLFATL